MRYACPSSCGLAAPGVLRSCQVPFSPAGLGVIYGSFTTGLIIGHCLLGKEGKPDEACARVCPLQGGDDQREACEVCGRCDKRQGPGRGRAAPLVPLLECDRCLRGFHLDCLDPALPAVPEVGAAPFAPCAMPPQAPFLPVTPAACQVLSGQASRLATSACIWRGCRAPSSIAHCRLTPSGRSSGGCHCADGTAAAIASEFCYPYALRCAGGVALRQLRRRRGGAGVLSCAGDGPAGVSGRAAGPGAHPGAVARGWQQAAVLPRPLVLPP